MQTHIILDGKTYALKPSFSALAKLEEALGQTITTLAIKLSQGEMTLAELAQIITCCLVPARPEEEVKNAILSSGFTHVTQAVAAMLALLFDTFDEQKPATVSRAEMQKLIAQFPD